MTARKKRLTKAALLRWLAANDACPEGMARIRKMLRTMTPGRAWAQYKHGHEMVWLADVLSELENGELESRGVLEAWYRFADDGRLRFCDLTTAPPRYIRKHFPWPLIEAAILDDIERGAP